MFVGNVLINILPSITLLTILSPVRFIQNIQASFGCCSVVLILETFEKNVRIKIKFHKISFPLQIHFSKSFPNAKIYPQNRKLFRQ